MLVSSELGRVLVRLRNPDARTRVSLGIRYLIKNKYSFGIDSKEWDVSKALNVPVRNAPCMTISVKPDKFVSIVSVVRTIVKCYALITLNTATYISAIEVV